MNACRIGVLVLVLAVLCPLLCDAQTTVPTVLGMSQEAAEGAIVAVGLVAVSSMDYSTATAGQVFFQAPAGGSNVSPGSTVRITISRGSVTPEAYNYQGLIYSLLGIAGGMAFVIGIRCGGA